MVYYSRQFKRHQEVKNSGRMTVVPQFGVPEIFIDNDEESRDAGGGSETPTRLRTSRSGAGSGAAGDNPFEPAIPTGVFLSATDGGAADRAAGQDTSPERKRRSSRQHSFSGISADVVPSPTSSSPPEYYTQGVQHPLAGPLSSGHSMLSPSTYTPNSHHNVFSFDFGESLMGSRHGGGGAEGTGTPPGPGGVDNSATIPAAPILSTPSPVDGTRSRGASDAGARGRASRSNTLNTLTQPEDGRLERGSVSPAQVLDMLDDTAWLASIRRSATVRRGDTQRRHTRDFGGS